MRHTSRQIILDEHNALSAMLQSMLLMVDRGPGKDPVRFFEVLRAMLFYIDEFPERQHHPKESDLLFPRLVLLAPETLEAVVQLEAEHAAGEFRVRELQHLLLAWELLGETRRADFEAAARQYARFYLEHMRIEETLILPVAERVLEEADWQALDAAFAGNVDPLVGSGPHDPAYDALFSRILLRTPAPIGLGDS